MADENKDLVGKKGFEDCSILEADDLFFARDENENIVPKKVEIVVGTGEKVEEQKYVGKDGKERVRRNITSVPIKKKIVITPLPRGEWIKMQRESKDGETTKDQDIEIIRKHLVHPSLTEKQIGELEAKGKHYMISAIAMKILEFSSLMVEKVKKKVD